jgi:D-glycero-alpha-D-manno-heptose-7-phosphate kinase
MIGSRTPYRISFVGGGTDMKVFYDEEPGSVVSASIAKYVYIFLHPYFDPAMTLVKYSQTELVRDIADIRHPLIRQALMRMDLPGLDINSIADIPAGTGLGSSSSFTVALLHALYAQSGVFVTHERLAREACEIEINELKNPIGKQDQYAAAYGGLNKITFLTNGEVKVEPIALGTERREAFHQHLMIFYTGQSRSASELLETQSKAVSTKPQSRDFLRAMAALCDPFVAALVSGDLADCGKLLDEGWQRKRQLTAGISNPLVDEAYARGLQHGALGGKLLGAGGGGFLLFVVRPEDRNRLRAGMAPLRELDFTFDAHGSSIIFVDGR